MNNTYVLFIATNECKYIFEKKKKVLKMLRTIADYLSSTLSILEKSDEALYEEVDLTKFIPSMPVAFFQTKSNSRKSTKTMIDPSAISKESINANRIKRLQSLQQSKPSEKDMLLQKQAKLEARIVEKNRKISELEKERSNLQKKLSDLKSRSSIRPRNSILRKQDVSEAEKAEVEFWKKKYEKMHKEYEDYMTALTKQGVCVRKSSNQLKAIPAPRKSK
jgi:hypothetical protein